MGQEHDTEVFCYFAEQTVEENILRLAGRQGLSLYTSDHHATLDATTLITTKATVDSPSKRNKGKAQKGDFVAKARDLLSIMFPHVFEPEMPRLSTPSRAARGQTPDAFNGNAIPGPSTRAA
jgi:E3 ubiquitin-protein ligase SHPRH